MDAERPQGELEGGEPTRRPRTRQDEIEEKKEEMWANIGTQEAAALAVLNPEQANQEPVSALAGCNLSTLVRILEDTSSTAERDWNIANPQAREALCQLIHWRIVRGACEIVDRIENGMRELFERRKETEEDLHVMWRSARRPLVQFFQQPHVWSFIESHDIDGRIYATMLRYVGNVKFMPSCELMFGGGKDQIAHLKCTDTFEDSRFHFFQFFTVSNHPPQSVVFSPEHFVSRQFDLLTLPRMSKFRKPLLAELCLVRANAL